MDAVVHSKPPYFDPHALREEHDELYVGICEIVELAQTLFLDGRLGALSMRIPRRFEEYHRRLEKHECDENELILQAFCDDIGVGD